MSKKKQPPTETNNIILDLTPVPKVGGLYPHMKTGQIGTSLATATTRYAKPEPVRYTENVQYMTKDGQLSFIIPKKLKDKLSFRPTAMQLLDYLQVLFTERGQKTIVLTLDEYMQIKQINPTQPNRNRLREEMKKDVTSLTAGVYTWTEKKKGKNRRDKGREEETYSGVTILQDFDYRNNVFTVTFSDKWAQYLNKSYLTRLPLSAIAIDARNPSAYALAKKFSTHYAMEGNRKRKTHDIISVFNALKFCPGIPTVEDVRAKRQSLVSKIILPFEKALDAGSGSYEWEYCNAKKEPLSDEQLCQIGSGNAETYCPDWETFTELYVRFKFHDHPTDLIPEEKADRP